MHGNLHITGGYVLDTDDEYGFRVQVNRRTQRCGIAQAAIAEVLTLDGDGREEKRDCSRGTDMIQSDS